MSKFLKYYSLFLILLFGFWNWISFADWNDVKINDFTPWSSRNDYLEIFKDSSFFWGSEVWEKWSSLLLINIAKDIKNMAIAVAIIYLIILVLRLLFSPWTDDDIKKWKTWIMWTTIGIILMQTAFVIVSVLFNKDIGAGLASSFLDAVIRPIIRLLEMCASFIFISMAIFAFYKLVTSSGWWDETFKKWVQTITSAIIGFILIKISGTLVDSIYWKVDCSQTVFGTKICTWANLGNPDLSNIAKIIWKVLQYATGFIWIVTILLIIYAGFMLVSSRWNPDSMKKAKNAIIYIFIWIFLIVTSVIIFRFMWWGEFNPVWTYS
jgi:hypothetical protein